MRVLNDSHLSKPIHLNKHPKKADNGACLSKHDKWVIAATQLK